MNFDKLDHFLNSFLAMGIPGNDCIVMKEGKIVYRRFNGFSNLAARIPMNGKERYHIFSCSKPLTCTAALLLWEKGLYKMEDHLSDYMPEFARMNVKKDGKILPAKNPITIHNLFTMTAGLNYDTQSKELCAAYDDTNGACPTREVMKYLARAPLDFEPGERYQYSLCHDVLAALVEVISGEKFEDFVKKHIFDPLGMKYSTFLLPKKEQDTIIPLYRYTNVLTEVPREAAFLHTYRLGAQYASGGAGAVSTVEDYILFLEAMRKGDILLKNSTIDMMTSPQNSRKNQVETPPALEPISVARYRYGLGLRCPVKGITTDSGWGGAAGAYLAFDRENNITVFYAQHVLNPPNGPLRQEIIEYVKEALH